MQSDCEQAQLRVSVHTKLAPNKVELRMSLLLDNGTWHRVATFSISGAQYLCLFRPMLLAGAEAVKASVELDESAAPSLRHRGRLR